MLTVRTVHSYTDNGNQLLRKTKGSIVAYIGEKEVLNSISLYPSPTSASVYLVGLEFLTGTEVLVKIVNMTGIQVANVLQVLTSNQMEINTSGLKSGDYLVQIQ